MSNPWVRETARMEDNDGRTVIVGVDYDTVRVGGYWLNREQCEEFGRAFIAACWEASDNARLMAEEADTQP